MSKEKQFFEMPSGDKFTLIALLVYAVVTFFFVQSSATISKMAVFGWMMGVFMFIAPIISLTCMNLDYAKADKMKQKAKI